VDLRSLLAAVEESSPVDAIDALSQELARTIEAGHVAVLLANFSGNALVRMSHVLGKGREQAGHNERVESLSLPGTVYERVLFTQAREVVKVEDGWLVLVPITERGDVIGLPKCHSPMSRLRMFWTISPAPPTPGRMR
jgi:hypothetical protein